MNDLIFRTFLILTLLAGVAAAQTPPPPLARIQTDSQETKTGPPSAEKSLADLKAGETFYFPEGNFSISLPGKAKGAWAEKDGKDGSALTYMWFLEEGIIILTYETFTDPAFSLKTDKEYQDFFDAHKNEALKRSKAKRISEGPLNSGEFRGWFVAFQMPDGSAGFARDFYGNRKRYSLTAFIKKDVPRAGELMGKALDSFKPGAKPELSAEMRKHIEKNTPAALPQEPAATRDGSDAADDNLKGRVRSIVHESEDVGRSSGRHFSSIEDYNSLGNLVRDVSFDWQLKPRDITVFGYIDGARVKKSTRLSFPDDIPDPPAMLMPPSPNKPKPRDPRYTYKYEYKYANGRLIEELHIWNDGELTRRIVHNYNGNRKETLVYDDKGRLYAKHLYILDEKGNEIERTDFKDPLRAGKDDIKWVYTYDAFDEKGNWTKKTMSKVIWDGSERLTQVYYVYYRTITYWP